MEPPATSSGPPDIILGTDKLIERFITASIHTLRCFSLLVVDIVHSLSYTPELNQEGQIVRKYQKGKFLGKVRRTAACVWDLIGNFFCSVVQAPALPPHPSSNPIEETITHTTPTHTVKCYCPQQGLRLVHMPTCRCQGVGVQTVRGH